MQRAARRPSRAVASRRTSKRSSVAPAIGAKVVERRQAGWGCKPTCLELRCGVPGLLAGALISAVALLEARHPAWCNELPTRWEIPPGDPLEHMTAGLAKVLCSALFITGRDLATARDEDGFFVSPRAERSKVLRTIVDANNRAVHLTLPNGVTRTAKLYGDQGCVTLPRGAESVSFTPVRVPSSLPDPATHPWPMGDLLPDGPHAPEIDRDKLESAVTTTFDPPWALTAAFAVAYKGRLIAERYQPGIDHTTRLPGWSMGKSLTATLMGQLIHERVYDLWAPASVETWQRPDDPRRAIRIVDLLRMSSGLRFVAPQDPDFDPSRGYADHSLRLYGRHRRLPVGDQPAAAVATQYDGALPQLRPAGAQLSHQEGGAGTGRGVSLLPATAPVRPTWQPPLGSRR